MNELLPCPFCGCEAHWMQESNEDLLPVELYHVECMNPNCWTQQKSLQSKEAAIALWNNRYSIDMLKHKKTSAFNMLDDAARKTLGIESA